MTSIHDPIREITEDVLEPSGLADAIFNRLNSNDCPSVLEVYGGWGSGKSSLINLLCQLNSQQKPKQLHIEIFDPWKYDSGASLLMPGIIQLVTSRSTI
jgi:predicted KAP-like P-loop ATPase